MAMYDEKGHEVPDPTPLALPLGMKKPETLEEMMGRMLRNQNYLKAFEGAESFEEADDFDVGTEDNPLTPYEAMMVPLIPEELPTLPTREPSTLTAQNGNEVQSPSEPQEELPKKEAISSKS